MKRTAFGAIALLIMTILPTRIAASQTTQPTAEAKVASVTFGNQTGGDGTAGAPAEVDLSDFSATFDVECSEGSFDQNVSGYIFYDASTTVADLDGGVISLVSGESGAVTVSADLSARESDHIYLFVPWSAENGQLGVPYYFRSASGARADREAAALRVYAHADTDCFTIVSPDPMTELSFYTTDGELAQGLSVDGDYSVTVDISNLTDGLYVLEATYSNGTIAMDRLIKR